MNKTKGLLLAAGVGLAMAFTLSCSFLDKEEEKEGGGNTFTDSRDGREYRKTTIGTQTWMAENLDYDVEGSKCYKNESTYCDTYGRLYDWSTAMSICPSGWHLPSKEEWDLLGNDNGKLKATSGWNRDGNGTDDYGFSALPGGYGQGNSFFLIGEDSNWWSSSETGSNSAYCRSINYSDSNNSCNGSGRSSRFFSVRCIENN